MSKIILQLALKTVSEANISEHWSKSGRRHRQQQQFISKLFLLERPEMPLPCVILMVRLSPYQLDYDNLVMAFKWIKDQIGACMFPEKVVTCLTKTKKGDKTIVKKHLNKGHADSDARVKWEYSQEKSRKTGIRIEISPWIQEPQRDNPL